MELTKEEEKAVKSLQILAKTWPKTLWLFAGNGLTVMKGDEVGHPIHRNNGCVDNNYCVCKIDIQADGGDF